MAPKGTHRVVGTHSRTASSSRVQNTQVAQGPKKNGATDGTHAKAPPYARSSSAVRVQQKDQLQPAHVRQNGVKQRTNFTIATQDSAGEDEWATESGAVTPNHLSSDEDVRKPICTIGVQPAVLPNNPPHPETAALRASSAGARPQGDANETTDASFETSVPGAPAAYRPPRPPPLKRASAPVLGGPSLSSRPPSTHSSSSAQHQHGNNGGGSSGGGVRPVHPLMRKPTAGQFSPKQAVPAPLNVVSDEAHAHISASPPTGLCASSPSSPSLSEAAALARSRHTAPDTPPFPDLSLLPFTPSATHQQLHSPHFQNQGASHPHHHHQQQHQPQQLDRQRTLSTLSSSSTASIAVLSSFAHVPAMGTRPSTPQRVVLFPPPERASSLEAIHPLLPPPYVNAHLTVLAHRVPLRESYERVIRAKHGR